MTREDLAARLVAADDNDRAALFEEQATLLDSDLAQSIKALFDDAKYNDPLRAHRAAGTLDYLARLTSQPRITAYAIWTAGVALLQLDGQAELSIPKLDEAAARFEALGMPRLGAATQLNKIHALAILGRYDEASTCGLRARDALLALGDRVGAAQIEQNLGNISFRRDRYWEAEQLYRAALEGLEAEGDQKQLVLIETCLATALIYQYKFRDAVSLYERALARADKTNQVVAQAAIECDLGCLALFQGRYDDALGCLESSRRRYVSLGMSHESAIAEQELADAYLELTLAPEAAEIYERIIPQFAELGMRAEQARALSCHGRACLLLGRPAEAHAALSEARALYASEGNEVGEALVTLTEAQLCQSASDFAAAAALASRAEAPLLKAGSWERSLAARWLRGEAARSAGENREAQFLFRYTLRDAETQALPHLAQRCHTSLGLLAEESGDASSAEASFKRAIDLVEDLRALLPSDEFRTAFVSDKLTPYIEMVRLCLAGHDLRATEALGYVERARSRALIEMMEVGARLLPKPRDRFELQLLEQIEELREELNWMYRQVNQLPNAGGSTSTARIAMLKEETRKREQFVLELSRQLEQRGGMGLAQAAPVDIEALQRSLGDDTALIEYFSLDHELLAFVVTGDRVEVVRDLARDEEVNAALDRLRYQINSLRYGSQEIRRHSQQLTARARHHLAALYDLLLEPIDNLIGARRLAIIPHRALHYVPFHALHDGTRYVIERREVVLAPSAAVLSHCLKRQRRGFRSALLMGVPDERAPRVRDEITTLAPMFAKSVALLGDEATRQALCENVATADVLHLACHGQFRADNPLFSSLLLADGWFAVRDAYALDLNGALVTLSACETGISSLAPGDEIIGLARGFLSAGAPSLLMTLWTVDDERTAEFMRDFYSHLLDGENPASSLRRAQLQMLEREPHPFFWSPFVMLGRW